MTGALSSLLLFGSYAFQTVLGRPDASRAHVRASDYLKRSVDSFVETETPIALSRLLCNIGSTGCYASGVRSGVVLASPSQNNPDYFYTWTRDSALTLKEVIDIFANDYNSTLQTEIQNYIGAQAVLQGVSNPSGSLSDGTGLGEPKFNVDLSAFTGSWGEWKPPALSLDWPQASLVFLANRTAGTIFLGIISMHRMGLIERGT